MDKDPAFTMMDLITKKKKSIPWRQKDKLVLLYPIRELAEAKYSTFNVQNMFYEDPNEANEHEVKVMGVRVIGCPIAKPLFVLSLDE